MPLAAYTGNETGREIYQDRDGSIWRIQGYIDRPAVILKNLETGHTITEVIGCPNADRWTQLVEIEQQALAAGQAKEPLSKKPHRAVTDPAYIDRIKLYRQRWGCSLSEAKDAIDSNFDLQPIYYVSDNNVGVRPRPLREVQKKFDHFWVWINGQIDPVLMRLEGGALYRHGLHIAHDEYDDCLAIGIPTPRHPEDGADAPGGTG
jgi:hypothetical protein